MSSLTSSSVASGGAGPSAGAGRRGRRDRHGRGLRGVLMPTSLPGSRTRAQRFDDRVLDVVEHLERHWADQLRDVEFAVEDVPYVEATSFDEAPYDADVLDDAAVPLARVIPGRIDESGQTVPPRIVLYRRPLEARALDDVDLDDLVHDVVVEQVANLLGMPPEEVDPSD